MTVSIRVNFINLRTTTAGIDVPDSNKLYRSFYKIIELPSIQILLRNGVLMGTGNTSCPCPAAPSPT